MQCSQPDGDELRQVILAKAQYFVDCKYVLRADERQKSMGLAYVEAERQDLAGEIASFAMGHASALQARVNELTKALQFYADARRYQGANQHPIPNDQYAKPDAAYIMDVTRDGGSVAVRALATSLERSGGAT